MSRSSLTIAMGVAWLLSGCAGDIERARLADLDAVSAGVAKRLAIDPVPVPSGPDDGALDPTVEARLADGLDEHEAVAIALANNRRVRVVAEQVGVSRAELVQAGLLPNPSLAGAAKFSGHGTNVELELVQSLVELVFLPSRKRIAKAHLAAEKASATRELLGIAFEARRAMVHVRERQLLLEVARRSHQAAATALNLTDTLRTAGNVTGLQRSLVALEESRARLDLAAAEAALVEARERLNLALGLWGEATTWRLAGTTAFADAVQGYDLERIESRAVVASLDLAENGAHAEAMAHAAGLAEGQALFPMIEAGAAAERAEEGGGWGVGPALALEIPVFDTGAARIAKARSRLLELRAHHVELAVHVRSAARMFRARLVSLDERTRYLRDVHLPHATKRTIETLRLYNAMQVGAFPVIAARRDEMDVEREAIGTQRAAWLARLDLEELLAGRLPANMPHAESTPEPAETRTGPGGH